MPYSDKQRKFFYAEEARAKAGKKTKTGMSAGELHEHAHAPMKKATSHMPKGASLRVTGDVGKKRQMEARSVVPISGVSAVYESGFKDLSGNMEDGWVTESFYKQSKRQKESE